MREQLVAEGGYLVQGAEKALLRAAYWDAEGHRTANTIARPAATIAGIAGFEIPADRSFLIVEESEIGREHPFSTEKLGPVLSLFRYEGFDQALDMALRILATGGRGQIGRAHV